MKTFHVYSFPFVIFNATFVVKKDLAFHSTLFILNQTAWRWQWNFWCSKFLNIWFTSHKISLSVEYLLYLICKIVFTFVLHFTFYPLNYLWCINIVLPKELCSYNGLKSLFIIYLYILLICIILCFIVSSIKSLWV